LTSVTRRRLVPCRALATESFGSLRGCNLCASQRGALWRLDRCSERHKSGHRQIRGHDLRHFPINSGDLAPPYPARPVQTAVGTRRHRQRRLTVRSQRRLRPNLSALRRLP